MANVLESPSLGNGGPVFVSRSRPANLQAPTRKSRVSMSIISRTPKGKNQVNPLVQIANSENEGRKQATAQLNAEEAARRGARTFIEQSIRDAYGLTPMELMEQRMNMLEDRVRGLEIDLNRSNNVG